MTRRPTSPGIRLGMRPTHALLLTFALALVGCTEPSTQPGSPAPQTDLGPTATRALDGDMREWGEAEQSFADGRWLWLRLEPGTRPAQAIQAAPYTTRVRIDVDLDAQTGASMPYPPTGGEAIGVQPQGVDMLIAFSPINDQGSVGIGTGVTGYDASGKATDLGHASIGVACLPTYASEAYELRLDRLAPASGVLPASGKIEVVIDQVDASGQTLWWDRIVVELPEREAQPALNALNLPAKPADGVRVMSANVLFSAPLKEPEPFQRLLTQTAPDVILYQEWFRTDRASVEQWLADSAGPEWSLHFPDERAGVAIATRGELLARYDQPLPPSGEGRPARACAALVRTDAGELLAISVHLKCCGSAGSEEDLTRIDQAKAINAFVDWVHEQHPDAMVVIGGDFNLVGSRTPLDVMARGLGVNGDSLLPAPAAVLGDASYVTWVDEKSRFGPGRLDWMLYDPSRSNLVNAFMLDTRVLTDEALEAMGLVRTDSMGSDHLPMLVDLTRAP